MIVRLSAFRRRSRGVSKTAVYSWSHFYFALLQRRVSQEKLDLFGVCELFDGFRYREPKSFQVFLVKRIFRKLLYVLSQSLPIFIYSCQMAGWVVRAIQGRGVRQGDRLSGWYFSVYLDELTRAVTKNRSTTVKIGERSRFILKYADDVV